MVKNSELDLSQGRPASANADRPVTGIADIRKIGPIQMLLR